MVYEVKREEVTQEQWDEMKKITQENVCAICGAELQIHTNPEKGTLENVIKRLTREQAEEFVKEINSRVEKQRELF